MPGNHCGQSSKGVSPLERLTILIVGRQEVFQRAIRELITPQPDMVVAVATQDLLEGSRWLKRGIAQVVILDWPIMEHGAEQIIIDLMRMRLGVKWLAVSLYDDDYAVKQAFERGIRGYVTKAMAADTICEAIRELHQGRFYCSPDVLECLSDSFLRRITSNTTYSE